MAFLADLHIHSKYSRATARNLDFENIYHAARIKGITVVGTGDFTHPAWVNEMVSKLEPAEHGLFALKKEPAAKMDAAVPESCRYPVRFMLQAEISTIYKKAGQVRKNHNIIYFPDLASVKKFNARLDAIGNITSDGRPILGLDARDLLEIMLEVNDQGFFVPAHIWTPWFSLFGSKSGFDHISECFEDLSSHIFAVETGLSSNPPMNWRVSDLDHIRLMSNSDAHSPGYLGRNACVFNTDLDYFAMRRSLETLDLEGYLGTLDMYPDQGKYHFDGHRKCGVSMDPEKTARHGGICPACGRPLTLGVLYRVRELADRPPGFVPDNRQGHTSIIPLADMLSEIFGVGPKTKKVTQYYDRAVKALGPELEILTRCGYDRIQAAGMPLLAEAVKRMRSGNVHVSPGFDGEYGKVRVFTPEELARYKGDRPLEMTLRGAPIRQTSMFSAVSENFSDIHPVLPKKKLNIQKSLPVGTGSFEKKGLLEGLNARQLQAVVSGASAILITAGPGTGKTRTLTARIAHLVTENQVPPDRILALTFTNKAAGELQDRIQTVLPPGGPRVTAATFHGFCLAMLKEYEGITLGLLEDDVRKELVSAALEKAVEKRTVRRIDTADQQISRCKQQLLAPEDDLSGVDTNPAWLTAVYAAYEKILKDRGGMDFEDLIFRFYRLLKGSGRILNQVRSRFTHIFVDEYQDLNQGQYALVKLLAKNSHLFVIGDPDQSIYGFRGSDHRFFNRFAEDYPGCEQIGLTRNYRSTQIILDASFQMISKSYPNRDAPKIFSEINGTRHLVIRETATETAEAVAVGKWIEAGVGGMSMDVMNTRQGERFRNTVYGFGDFAVLFRTRRQQEIFARVFQKHGIPFQTADKKAGFDRSAIAPVLSCFRILTGRWGTRDIQNLYAHLKITKPKDAWGERPDRILAPVKDRIQGRTSHDCLNVFTRFLGVEKAMAEDPAAAPAFTRIQMLAGAFEDPGAFMDQLVLEQDPDQLADAAQKVSLLTLHAAKGLEFPVVFVTGCEQGLIPFAREKSPCDNPAEERRLFYVAMTRAMDMLYLTYARKRQMFGVRRDRQPSVFLMDIETRLIRRETQDPVLPEKKQPRQLELF
jgi:DNA helicase II / ATP-dependent DNA helicase PcrA